MKETMKQTMLTLAMLCSTVACARVQVDAIGRYDEQVTEYHGVMGSDTNDGEQNVARFESNAGACAQLRYTSEDEQGATFELSLVKDGQALAQTQVTFAWDEEKEFKCPQDGVDAAVTVRVSRVTQ